MKKKISFLLAIATAFAQQTPFNGHPLGSGPNGLQGAYTSGVGGEAQGQSWAGNHHNPHLQSDSLSQQIGPEGGSAPNQYWISSREDSNAQRGYLSGLSPEVRQGYSSNMGRTVVDSSHPDGLVQPPSQIHPNPGYSVRENLGPDAPLRQEEVHGAPLDHPTWPGHSGLPNDPYPGGFYTTHQHYTPLHRGQQTQSVVGENPLLQISQPQRDNFNPHQNLNSPPINSQSLGTNAGLDSRSGRYSVQLPSGSIEVSFGPWHHGQTRALIQSPNSLGQAPDERYPLGPSHPLEQTGINPSRPLDYNRNFGRASVVNY